MTDKTVYVATIQENPRPELNTYRIWFGDPNERNELGRVSAIDIDEATEYAVKQYLNPNTEYEENGDSEHICLMLDMCKDCEYKETLPPINMDCNIEDCSECIYIQCEENTEYESICDYCELSEYLEIILDNETEKEYKTIYGTNEYADLETGELPYDYDLLLAKAWGKDPQAGADQLMRSTIEKNPELFSAIDREYLKRLFETREKVTKT